MMVNMLIVGMRKGEELKTPHYASAAATRNDRLPIPNTSNSFFIVATYI